MLEYDPYDTPPPGMRIALGIFCLVLCGLILGYLLPRGNSSLAIASVGTLLLAGMFIFTANTGVKATLATVIYMVILGAMAVLAPAG